MHVTTKNKKVFVMPNMDFTTFDAEDIIVTSGGGVTHTLSENGMSCSCEAFRIIGPNQDYWRNDIYGYHNKQNGISIMRLKDTFVTQDIGGVQMMIPVGKSAELFKGYITNNETAAFIVDQLKIETTKEKLISALLDEYEVEADMAAVAVDYVIDNLNKIQALEQGLK